MTNKEDAMLIDIENDGYYIYKGINPHFFTCGRGFRRGCILSASIVVNLCLAVAINAMEHSTEANTMLQIKIYEYVNEALV